MKKESFSEYFKRIGMKGGSSGRGECKRRGDSKYYQKLSRRRKNKSVKRKKTVE